MHTLAMAGISWVNLGRRWKRGGHWPSSTKQSVPPRTNISHSCMLRSTASPTFNDLISTLTLILLVLLLSRNKTDHILRSAIEAHYWLCAECVMRFFFWFSKVLNKWTLFWQWNILLPYQRNDRCICSKYLGCCCDNNTNELFGPQNKPGVKYDRPPDVGNQEMKMNLCVTGAVSLAGRSLLIK